MALTVNMWVGLCEMTLGGVECMHEICSSTWKVIQCAHVGVVIRRVVNGSMYSVVRWCHKDDWETGIRKW